MDLEDLGGLGLWDHRAWGLELNAQKAFLKLEQGLKQLPKSSQGLFEVSYIISKQAIQNPEKGFPQLGVPFWGSPL